MKNPLNHHWGQMLRDTLTEWPVGYFVILHPELVQFVRVTRSKRFQVLLQRDCRADDPECVARFSEQLKDSPYYYGQSMAILINNLKAFSYVRHVRSAELLSTVKRLKLMQPKDMTVDFGFRTNPGSTLVVAQGIDRGYLDSMLRAVDTAQLRVTGILTLPVYLAMYTPLLSKKRESFAILNWPHAAHSYVASRLDGSAVIGPGDSSGESDGHTVSDQTRLTLFPEGVAPKPVHYCRSLGATPNGGTVARPLAELFRDTTLLDRRSKGLAKRTHASRMAATLTVASNSLKLLLLLLLPVMAVATVATGFLGLQAGTGERTASRYQTLYSEEYALQRMHDSLANLQSAYVSDRRSSVPYSALMSLLCQEKQTGLYLNSIAVKRAGGDSIVVEITGSAHREGSVFEHNRRLNDRAKPMNATIVSVRPEIVSLQGVIDTVVSFKYAMVLHEEHTQK